jgi:hypothetical protein
MPSIAENAAKLQQLKTSGGIVPVDEVPPGIVPAVPPTVPVPNPRLRSPLPSTQWTTVDSLRNFEVSTVPQVRTPPAPPQAIIAQGAASASQASQVITSGGGGLTSVGLIMPSQYTTANDPLLANGSILVGWQNVSPLTVLSGPGNPNGDALDTAVQAASSGTGVTSLAVPILTPNTANELALLFAETTINKPPGFTSILGSSTFYSQFPATSPINLTVVYPGGGANFPYAHLVTLYTTGNTPVISNPSNQSLSTSPQTLSSFSATTGTTLVIHISGLSSTAIPSFGITDSAGNIYEVSTSSFVNNGSRFGTTLVASNITGGTLTLTVSWTGTFSSASIFIYAVTNTSVSSGLPSFKPLQSAFLPPPNVNNASGILPVANGGTGANLSATGGTNQVLQQSSSGANVSVGQLSASSLTSFQSINLTAQNANISPTSWFTATAGLYRISSYIIVEQAASVSSTMPDTQIVWVDRDSGATITANVTAGNTGNTTSTFAQASTIINPAASSAVKYATGQVTAYASSGATPMLYNYRLRAEFIGA